MDIVSPRNPTETSIPPAPSAARRVDPWQWLTRTAAVALVIVVALVGYKLVRLGRYGWAAYQNGAALLSTVRAQGRPETLVEIQPQLTALSTALSGLEREMQPLAPLLHSLDGLTVYGSTLAAAPELLAAGAEMTAIAEEGARLVGPALAQAPEGSRLEAAAGAFAGQDEAFASMVQHAQRANRALLAIDARRLHPSLVAPLALAQEFSPLMAPSLQLGPALPDLLGMNRPVTYLLLVQNNHELRGTGGFISGVGELTVERGRIVSLDFSDSYRVDNHSVDHPRAPDIMRQYMGIELLFLRDANWSPDLPTSARTARNIYKRDRGKDVDGVITIDLRAVELIVEGVGPIRVEGVEESITEANVVEIIKRLWDQPLSGETTQKKFSDWWAQRKDFMPTLAGAVLEKLKSGRFNYFTFVRAARQALDERAVQIWLANPQAQEQLAAWGWDGGLHPQVGADYLALVDSNVGYNKVNAVVERSLAYRIDWPEGPGRPGVAQAQVTYRHPLEAPGYECDQTARYGDSYDDMMRRCYFDYVRLYVPRGSELIGIDGVDPDSVHSRRGEQGTQVFGGFFVLKPGQTHTVTFTYRLPVAIQASGYRLIVQRQSGSGPLPLSWTIGNRLYRVTVTKNRFDWTPSPR